MGITENLNTEDYKAVRKMLTLLRDKYLWDASRDSEDKLGNQFICNCFGFMWDDRGIDKCVLSITREYFIDNKPNDEIWTEFTKHKNWTGGYVWWDSDKREVKSFHIDYLQRIKFLTALIEQLN